MVQAAQSGRTRYSNVSSIKRNKSRSEIERAMAKELKVAFAGARRSSSFFKAFQSHPETQIVALCDAHEPTLYEAGKATMAKRYGVTRCANNADSAEDKKDRRFERSCGQVAAHSSRHEPKNDDATYCTPRRLVHLRSSSVVHAA